jgi:hypothetical protein
MKKGLFKIAERVGKKLVNEESFGSTEKRYFWEFV